MAFTTVTVTRDYDLADGTDPAGTVTFTPTAPMINGPTVVAAPVVGKLDVDGALSIDLAANTDPTTLPTGVNYLVKEAIAGTTRAYYVQIPHDQGTNLDLSTLASVGIAPAISFPGQPLLWTRFVAAPVTVTYAASITLNAALGDVFRVAATGDLTLTDITNGVDGQQVILEVLASGAARVVTVTGGYTVTVSSGTWWTGHFRYNATAAAWLQN